MGTATSTYRAGEVGAVRELLGVIVPDGFLGVEGIDIELLGNVYYAICVVRPGELGRGYSETFPGRLTSRFVTIDEDSGSPGTCHRCVIWYYAAPLIR